MERAASKRQDKGILSGLAGGLPVWDFIDILQSPLWYMRLPTLRPIKGRQTSARLVLPPTKKHGESFDSPALIHHNHSRTQAQPHSTGTKKAAYDATVHLHGFRRPILITVFCSDAKYTTPILDNLPRLFTVFF